MSTTQHGRPVLVTGATGNTGRAIVDELARRGAPVRAMVRAEADRAKLPAGIPVAVADFDDPASIARALEGAERAYLVTPSSEQAEDQQRRFAELEDYAHYRRGQAAAVSAAVAEITGRPPIDVRQFARDYAPAFKG